MNEVRAAKPSESRLNGQEYVNLRKYVRDRYEGAMVNLTHTLIRIGDVEIGEIVLAVEQYIRQCDEEKANTPPTFERED